MSLGSRAQGVGFMFEEGVRVRKAMQRSASMLASTCQQGGGGRSRVRLDKCSRPCLEGNRATLPQKGQGAEGDAAQREYVGDHLPCR